LDASSFFPNLPNQKELKNDYAQQSEKSKWH
jgi:hypothetical protein